MTRDAIHIDESLRRSRKSESLTGPTRTVFRNSRAEHRDARLASSVPLETDSWPVQTCLMMRYMKGTFLEGSKMTVGADFLAKNVPLEDGRLANLVCW